MAYTIYLTDSAGTHELPPLEVPLTVTKNEAMTVVQPLSANQYTDYIATKRAFSHTWAWLTKEQYDMLDEIYERMKSDYTYPELTISDEGVTDLTVRYELSPKNIINECGDVQDVTIALFETRQLGS